MTVTPTILVVEDSPTQAHQLKVALTERSLNVVIAEDGLEGLRLAEVHTPDLVVLDVKLPKMDGYQVCRRLKRDPKTADIPVIMFTSADGEENEQFGLRVGADEYIIKGPEALEHLMSSLGRLGIL